MTEYVLEALRERHPGRRITARQWVDANGIDVAEYIYGELLAEVPRQFRFIVECMAKRAVARAARADRLLADEARRERDKEESLNQNLSAYLCTDPRYIN
jgi:hypothetical protein